MGPSSNYWNLKNVFFVECSFLSAFLSNIFGGHIFTDKQRKQIYNYRKHKLFFFFYKCNCMNTHYAYIQKYKLDS